VTDTYDYDAWGSIVDLTGSTPNVYLYRGEQYDPDLNVYNLRARYFNQVTGRFLSTDPAEAVIDDPATLHRYLYADADPVNRIDPTGWAASGAVTPEAGGVLHFLMGPLTWFQSKLGLLRPACSWQAGGGGW
jgi:RHS repeat-associated protein